MKIKNIVASGIAAFMLLGSTAVFGATSSTSISYYDTGRDGATVSMSGSVKMSGYNSSSSHNSLWVELYRRSAGFDDRVTGSELKISQSTSWTVNVSSDLYYLHLDPDGPLYDGCIGNGSAVN
ncbi:hypothetical protein [Paenibacillus amylolyticus]|uniref:hypothetical protein n=1 Tax=Paenibacillus amylolyticus TaxID=1451 RepID=UPI003EB6E36C